MLNAMEMPLEKQLPVLDKPRPSLNPNPEP